MKRGERIGFVILVICLFMCSLLMSLVTHGGQAISNVFANIVGYLDYKYDPAVDALFEPLKQQLGLCWLIGLVTIGTALGTFIVMVGYLSISIQGHVPRSWLIFMVGNGTVASVMIVFAASIQAAIPAVAVPHPPVRSALVDNLVSGANGLMELGLFGGVIALTGLIALISSLRRPTET